MLKERATTGAPALTQANPILGGFSAALAEMGLAAFGSNRRGNKLLSP
jgi:hypothetical protein